MAGVQRTPRHGGRHRHPLFPCRGLLFHQSFSAVEVECRGAAPPGLAAAFASPASNAQVPVGALAKGCVREARHGQEDNLLRFHLCLTKLLLNPLLLQ